MYNSCMDYDEYDASTSSSFSASSSLVANNKYLTALGGGSWAASGTCYPSPARLPHKCRHGPSRLSFSSHHHHQVPINVHVHLYRQLSAGLPDYYGSRQPAVTVRPFPAIGYICCVRAYREVGTYIHHKYSEPSKRHEATWSLEICRDL